MECDLQFDDVRMGEEGEVLDLSLDPVGHSAGVINRNIRW